MYKSLKKMKKNRKKATLPHPNEKKRNPPHNGAGLNLFKKTYLTEKSNACKSLSSEELPYII